jgi:CubicO group peptidase (beta-lactamase class C family)
MLLFPLRCAVLPAVLVLALFPSAGAAAPGVDGERINAVLNEALKVWQAPGLAVVVVKNDEVVYLKGAGVRRVGEKEPVSPDTIFALGSCTKAFTATAFGLLVDDGKADWDDPVRKHLPWFRLSDPLADREVRLRDLLCHRTGVGRHDLLMYRAPWSVEETVRRLAFLEPHTSFRSAYEYNNLSYLAAGLGITATAGMPWDDFVQKRLLDPLGMKRAVFTRSAAFKKGDFATPHRKGPDGRPIPIDWYADDHQIRASGSLKASVRDLGPWLRLQLGQGKFAGKQLIAAQTLAETHTPQVVVALERGSTSASVTIQESYGLGWHIRDYRGHLMIEHGGANDGFRARMILLPRSHLGLALLTNLEDTSVLSATGDILIDLLLGLDKRDWHAQYLTQSRITTTEQQDKRKKLLAGRVPGTRPSREPEAYVGRYHEPAYGTVEIVRDKELVLKWSSFALRLHHFHYDTFLTVEEGAGKGEIPSLVVDQTAAFSLNGAGEVAEVRFLGRTFRRTRR